MPIQDNLPSGCICSDFNTDVTQTIFLGLSVTNFSASVGWDGQGSTMDINLIEDPCVKAKVAWDTCLTKHDLNIADPGFYGEPRWETPTGAQYSSCLPRSVDDTMIRPALDLIGSPAFFRIGTFEWCGIITDWQRKEDCPSGPQYSVKLVDPRVILQGVQLIVGDYSGRVDQFVPLLGGGTGCPSPNIFNVYGYMEQFGIYSPEFSQCAPCTYNFSNTCPTSVDGAIFGSPSYGFGGSWSNEGGMPVSKAILGFNLIANTLPATQNPFSPYGRVAYIKNDIPSGFGPAYGLMRPDQDLNVCLDRNNYYFVDITELPVTPVNYRLNDTSLSLMDLIDRMSQDFGFQYYVDLVPVLTGASEPDTCVLKFIKVRVVYRNTQAPSLNTICDFLGDKCAVVKSVGQELRGENNTKFVIGSKKYSLFQACQSTNPDGGVDGSITSIDSCTGLPHTVAGVCQQVDDAIIPYFGTEFNGDIIAPCKDVDGYWYFKAPTYGINPNLNCFGFPDSHITVTERELMAALAGMEEWKTYISIVNTDTWQAIFGRMGNTPLRNLDEVAAYLTANDLIAPRDVVNPMKQKFGVAINEVDARCLNDEETIYNWILKYAQDYYGKQFAVRTPFTACYGDQENQKPVQSDFPTNDGGWTEVANVLGLPNGGPLSLGTFEFLNFFRTQDGRIRPFVRVSSCAIGKDMTGFNPEDFFYVYTLNSTSGVVVGSGPPVTPPAGVGSNRIYQDSLNGQIYIYFWNESTWLPIQNVPVIVGSGAPGAVDCIRVNGASDDAPIYIDKVNCVVYLSPIKPAISLVGTEPKYCADPDDFTLQINISLYIKAEVSENYVYHNANCCFAPRVIVSIPQAITYDDSDEKVAYYISGLPKLAKYLEDNPPSGISIPVGFANKIKNSVQNVVGSEDAWFNNLRRATLIDGAAIPLRSETITYGPWTNPSTVGGNTEVVIDDGLAPWNFGSFARMNAAGQFLADSGRVDMRVGETGSITVPGYPSLPLGAELGAVAGGFYGGAEYLVENRTAASSSFTGNSYDGVDININPGGLSATVTYSRFNYSGAAPGTGWTGLFGPNITSISVDGGCPAQTTYSFRTFTPRKLGMSNWIVNQIQKINSAQKRNFDFIRSALFINKSKALANSFAPFNVRDDKRRTRPHGEIKNKSNPMVVFGGSVIEHADGSRRPIVVSSPTEAISEEIQNNYSKKAFMSLDGLLRPVSLDGDGQLPPLVFPCQVAPATPTRDKIFQDDLNPLTNPSTLLRNRVSQKRSDTPTIGHDFDILARETTVPSGGMIMPIAGYNNGAKSDYTDDYRYMALRGPLIMQSWGYDLDGYPVPNKNDNETDAANGIFACNPSGLDPIKFLDGHLTKSHTWAVAPIDLRLDRDRGVWTISAGGSLKASFSQDCVVYNIRPEQSGDCYEQNFDIKNVCFGRGIIVQAPCDAPDTGSSIAANGDVTVCPAQPGFDKVKIGAGIDFAYQSDISTACLYQEYLDDVDAGDPDVIARYGKTREGVNFVKVHGGLITRVSATDACAIDIATAGISTTVNYIDSIDCAVVPGSGIFRLTFHEKLFTTHCGVLNTNELLFPPGSERHCDINVCQLLEDCSIIYPPPPSDPGYDTNSTLTASRTVTAANNNLTFDMGTGVFTINGKLTVTGLIDPTGLELTQQAANPGGVAANTLWINSANNHLYRGAIDLESPTFTDPGYNTDSTLTASRTVTASNNNLTFNMGTGVFGITGKMTVSGLVQNPTGLEFTQQASNPGTVAANTLWINSANNHLFRGAVDIEAGATDAGYDISSTLTASRTITGGGNSLTFNMSGASAFNITGKLTVSGLVQNPTGVELTTQSANPGTVADNTLWINSANNHLYIGSIDLEAPANTVPAITLTNLTATSALSAGTVSIVQDKLVHSINARVSGNVSLTVTNNTGASIDITAISAVGDYFSAVTTATPVTIANGASTTIIVVARASLGSASIMRSGQIRLTFSTGATTWIGVSGIVET